MSHLRLYLAVHLRWLYPISDLLHATTQLGLTLEGFPSATLLLSPVHQGFDLFHIARYTCLRENTREKLDSRFLLRGYLRQSAGSWSPPLCYVPTHHMVSVVCCFHLRVRSPVATQLRMSRVSPRYFTLPRPTVILCLHVSPWYLCFHISPRFLYLRISPWSLCLRVSPRYLCPGLCLESLSISQVSQCLRVSACSGAVCFKNPSTESKFGTYN